jgi:tetratricopeptide (TPR) repeat protein
MYYRSPVLVVTAVLLALSAVCVHQAPPAFALDVGPEVENARNAIQAGRAQEAVDMLSRVITLEPQAQLYYYRGIAYSKSGEETLAIGDFTQAISLDPVRPAFYQKRAQSLFNCGKYKDAASDLSKVLEAEPNNTKALSQRAQTYLLLDRLQDAFRDVSRAIELSPGERVLHRWRADMLFAAGQYKDALQEYDIVLRMEPNDAIALNNRGVAQTHLGRNKEAVDDMTKAMEIATPSSSPKETATTPELPW